MKTILGIDLGTTNSEVAITRDGRPLVITDKKGKCILPSVVGISPQGEFFVGELALNQYIAQPENTIKSIKRKMGSDQKVALGGKDYSPQEISALILKTMKAIAENFLSETCTQAVITVPAYFSDKQRQATKDAGEIAGLEVVRILNEPTAAALAYGLDREEDQYLLVYDLGGGTFDVSVVEINSGVVEVLANHGDTQLGGDDFDMALVQDIAENFLKQHSIDLRQDRKSLARLIQAAEKAKIKLSNSPFAWIKEEFIAQKEGTPLHLEVEVESQHFETLIQNFLDSTMECVDKALKDASLEPDQINKVLLVGGSTRIPIISTMLEEKFGVCPHLEIDPDLCVAMGSGIQAGIIAGEVIDTVLVDVTPHSLGIEVVEWRMGMPVDDHYSPIIRRNTPIPISKSEVYTALMPDQEEVAITVYQGEEKIASRNTLLGEFMLEGIKSTRKGVPEVIVNFDYDINGIVHVTAQDKKTGKEKKIDVIATPDRLSEQEKIEASERVIESEIVWDDEVPANAEYGVALYERARALVENLENEKDKTELLELANKLKETIDKEDTETMAKVQEQLLDRLYDLEE